MWGNGMSTTVKIIEVTLSCNNELSFLAYAPKIGERLWCYKHEHYAAVVAVAGNYAWRCTKCTVRREGGAVRYNTYRDARSHTMRLGHITIVYRHGITDSEEQISPHNGTEQLPF